MKDEVRILVDRECDAKRQRAVGSLGSAGSSIPCVAKIPV